MYTTANDTIADRFRSGFTLHISCPDCGRHRPLPNEEVARKYGWDFSFAALKRRIVCRRCRVRGRDVLRESNNGIPPGTWLPYAEKVIRENPTRTVLQGPWKKG
jgi:hypothetical protein